MKPNIRSLFFALVILSGVISCPMAQAQGTAFNYQGRLNDGGAPANGSYDIAFSLFATNTSGVAIAGPVTNSAVGVTNGLFTTTVDFGNVFTGGSNWLEIAVSTNDANTFSPLLPRQQLTPVPYAITAGNLSGVVENNNVIQNGVSLGTISGGSGNTIQNAANEATIGGGGNNSIGTNSFIATISGGANNSVGANDDTSTISGGNQNVIQDGAGVSTIGGGVGNQIQTGAPRSTISGGSNNRIMNNAEHSFIGGGDGNQVQNGAIYSTIGGGSQNVIGTNAAYSAIVGGFAGILDSPSSYIGGGYNNQIQNSANYSAIAGGLQNTIQSNARSSSIGGGYQNAIQTNSQVSFIGGGYLNAIQANCVGAMVGGGLQNVIQANSSYSAIGGGDENVIQTGAFKSVIAGGEGNMIQSNAFYSSISGGYLNAIQTNASYSFIGGGGGNSIGINAYNSFLGGGDDDSILPNAKGSVLAGGEGNSIGTNAFDSFLGGGLGNQIMNNGQYATIPGGVYNTATNYAFAAGVNAQAVHTGAFVWADTLGGAYSSDRNNQFKIRAAGGVQMDISGSAGLNPAAVAISSTSGNGIGLLVNESSTDTSALFANNGSGDIVKGFSGGGNTVFEVLNDGTIISKGVVLTSDRNAKENFTTLNAQRVLAKVISLPVTEWNYKDDSSDKKHIGPMAQDFQAAFGLNGPDDTHISVVDEGGVALAAIQGLNQKLEQKETEIGELRQKNQSLEQRLDALEKFIHHQKTN